MGNVTYTVKASSPVSFTDATGCSFTNTTTAEVATGVAITAGAVSPQQVIPFDMTWVTDPVAGDLVQYDYDGSGNLSDPNSLVNNYEDGVDTVTAQVGWVDNNDGTWTIDNTGGSNADLYVDINSKLNLNTDYTLVMEIISVTGILRLLLDGGAGGAIVNPGITTEVITFTDLGNNKTGVRATADAIATVRFSTFEVNNEVNLEAQSLELVNCSDPTEGATSLSAIRSSSTSVNLTWVEPANTNGIIYKLYRDNIYVQDIASGFTEFIDTGLVDDTTYSYRLDSTFNNIGLGALSDSATTLALPDELLPIALWTDGVNCQGGALYTVQFNRAVDFTDHTGVTLLNVDTADTATVTSTTLTGASTIEYTATWVITPPLSGHRVELVIAATCNYRDDNYAGNLADFAPTFINQGAWTDDGGGLWSIDGTQGSNQDLYISIGKWIVPNTNYTLTTSVISSSVNNLRHIITNTNGTAFIGAQLRVDTFSSGATGTDKTGMRALSGSIAQIDVSAFSVTGALKLADANYKIRNCLGNPPNIVTAIGDSFVASHTWDEELDALTAGAVISDGRNGDELSEANALVATASIEDRFPAALVGIDWIIVQGGINDINRSTTTSPLPNMLATVTSMYDLAVLNGVGIGFCNVTPYKGNGGWSAEDEIYRTSWNAQLQAFCDSKGIQCYDISTALADPGDTEQLLAAYDFGDNLHPSDGVGSGSEKIATTIYNQSGIELDSPS